MRQITSIVLFSALSWVFIRADEISYYYNASFQNLKVDSENSINEFDKNSTSEKNILNETFENVTLYVEMMRAQTAVNSPFNPDYIYKINNSEILPNISLHSHPIEIESDSESIPESYIIELCDNATESDNQDLLTYIKIKDQNETLDSWFIFVIEDLWMPVNDTHGRWLLFTNETTDDAITDLANLLPICYIVADAKISSSVSLSWGLDRIDQEYLPRDQHYFGAWINQHNYDGRGVAVYVFDSGIYRSHQEFTNKPAGWVINAYDHFNCPSGTCYDKHSILYGNNDGRNHGTPVAATIGGKNVGVAPGTMINGVKILDDNGSGSQCNKVIAICRLMTEFRNKIQDGIPVIVSMSLIGKTHSASNRAIRDLYENGILSVVSAGNDGVSSLTLSPAGEPKAITVMASDKIDGPVSRSTWSSNYDGDIYAPGLNIYTANKDSSSSYKFSSGTSIACPHVSGILATLYQYNKQMSVSQATSQLFKYASKRISNNGWLALVPRELPQGYCHQGLPNGDWRYCSPSCKCNHGEGDCDSDNDCESGTYCGIDNGLYFGFSSILDICVDNSWVETSNPTFIPTPNPTSKPTSYPTSKPISYPTSEPIPIPTLNPTKGSNPIGEPTQSFNKDYITSLMYEEPTLIPTLIPTQLPSSTIIITTTFPTPVNKSDSVRVNLIVTMVSILLSLIFIHEYLYA